MDNKLQIPDRNQRETLIKDLKEFALNSYRKKYLEISTSPSDEALSYLIDIEFLMLKIKNALLPIANDVSRNLSSNFSISYEDREMYLAAGSNTIFAATKDLYDLANSFCDKQSISNQWCPAIYEFLEKQLTH